MHLNSGNFSSANSIQLDEFSKNTSKNLQLTRYGTMKITILSNSIEIQKLVIEGALLLGVDMPMRMISSSISLSKSIQQGPKVDNHFVFIDEDSIDETVLAESEKIDWVSENSHIIIILASDKIKDISIRLIKQGNVKSILHRNESAEVFSDMMKYGQSGYFLTSASIFTENRINSPSGEKLSPREIQILDLASNGMQYEEISYKLDLSKKTIAHYSLTAQRKLHAKTLPHAVAMYTRSKEGIK